MAKCVLRPAVCHWTPSLPALATKGAPLLVWVCEYPFRTHLDKKPDAADCGECPLRPAWVVSVPA